MLNFKTFASLYPNLAMFAGTYQRRSSLGRIYLVRKNRWGDSASRMYDRRDKIKRSLKGMVNTGRISESADSSLINLKLKNISNRNRRKAYAAVIKKASRGIGKII